MNSRVGKQRRSSKWWRGYFAVGGGQHLFSKSMTKKIAKFGGVYIV